MTSPSGQTPPHNQEHTFVDIVCEGGGVRGIALVGALSVLEQQGFQPQNLAGTSAGAIVMALYAAGYRSQELRTIISGLNFSRFMDTPWYGRLPAIGAPINLLRRLGVYRGDYFYHLMRRLLAAKRVYTFKDLRSPYADDPRYAADPRYHYKAQVIASDVSHQRLLILPLHARALGVEPDELEVALAVRMSMSIPIFFWPVHTRDALGARSRHLVVDGGLVSNFPIWLFDEAGTPPWPTLGLRLVEGSTTATLAAHDAHDAHDGHDAHAANTSPLPHSPRRGFGGLLRYATALINTMVAAHDRLALDMDPFARTMQIPTLGIPATNFKLQPDEIEALYTSGRATAEEFLKTWDFGAYVATFRSGSRPTWREVVSETMRQTKAEGARHVAIDAPATE
jgi:NTE family protein